MSNEIKNTVEAQVERWLHILNPLNTEPPLHERIEAHLRLSELLKELIL